MLALIGPRGNGKSTKLAQWAKASGGTILVADVNRAEHYRSVHGVSSNQLIYMAQLRDGMRRPENLTLVAVDDAEHILTDLLKLPVLPQLISFHGGAMTP